MNANHFEKFPASISKHLEEILSNPIPIELRSDGSLNIDENLSLSSNIDDLSNLVPDVPDLSGILDADQRKEIRVVFQVIVIKKALPYTAVLIDALLKQGKRYEEIKQALTEIGTDVEIILSAVSRKFTLQQSAEKQWGKYSLRYAEVIKLESVASLRREINVRRSNWESSEAYFVADKVTKAKREAQFEAEIKDVTDVLWKILHLGANYLTGAERVKIKTKTLDLTKKERLSYVKEEIVKIRIAYLAKWRVEGENFKVPRPKS
jgi:DNA-binding transcriptional ArsR family regulator